MIHLILNNEGNIVNTNHDFFKGYSTIYDFGFNKKSLSITIDAYETLLINIFEKNYIVKNLKMNLNDMGLIYLSLEEYKNFYINIDSYNKYNEFKVDNFDSIEQSLIFAIRNGYLQDKEIVSFLKSFTGVNYEVYKVSYVMKKLYTKFDAYTRSELLRKIYLYQLDNFFPKHFFKPGIYSMKYQQLQHL